MNLKKYLSIVLCFFVFSGCAVKATAVVDAAPAADDADDDLTLYPAVYGDNYSGISNSSFVGFSFTIDEAITVWGLGAVNAEGTDGAATITGIATTVPVGLYDSNGDLLASSNVTSGSLLVGGFRYELLDTPVSLSIGTYTLLALFDEDNYFAYYNSSSPTYFSPFTFVDISQSSNSLESGLPSEPPANDNSWGNEYISASLLYE